MKDLGNPNGLGDCLLLDTGCGSGKLLVHGSFYCPVVIGVENDLITYLIAAGMLGTFKSERIAMIQSNFKSIPIPFPNIWGKAVVIFDNSVGWDPGDREHTRLLVDLTDSIKVVATNWRFDRDFMNLSQDQCSTNARWKLFANIENAILSGSGENLRMKVFIKVRNGESTSLFLQSNPLSLDHTKTLLDRKLTYHFLEHENNEFLMLSADGIQQSRPSWNDRAYLFLNNYDSCDHGLGRIVKNYNNCCYANSFLGIFCNISILRPVIDLILQKSVVPNELDSDSSETESLLYIFWVYTKSREWAKSPFLLPYKKTPFQQAQPTRGKKSSPTEYFPIGTAMNNILSEDFTSEDQGEWLHITFFPNLREMSDTDRHVVDQQLHELIGYIQEAEYQTECGYETRYSTPNSFCFILNLGVVPHENYFQKVPMNDLLLLNCSSKYPTDFTNHFYPYLREEQYGTIYEDHSCKDKLEFVQNPKCLSGSVVYHSKKMQFGTVVEAEDDLSESQVRVCVSSVSNILSSVKFTYNISTSLYIRETSRYEKIMIGIRCSYLHLDVLAKLLRGTGFYSLQNFLWCK